MRSISQCKIAMVGLGYVGLPLAVEFGKQIETVGLDINSQRITELIAGEDRSKEVEHGALKQATMLRFTSDPADLASCNVYIVTVPTPIDDHKRPDLGPLESASRMIGKSLNVGDLVIYESTVYPGATEEFCIPILEEVSGLVYNRDFHAGYSPERINPGDKEHGVTTIKKVTSGSTPEAAEFVDQLYRSVITAGTHKASSIMVAEAAKVIENTQRDVNIALINELAILFHRLGLNTHEVLEAAGSKWNFLPFTPGLVGGHCIGVDPYYLTHKAQQVGHHPKLILAGRRINDQMGAYLCQRLVKLMAQNDLPVCRSRILLLGLTFKENCPDIRNTRVADMIDELNSYHAAVDVHDPWADPDAVRAEFGFDLTTELQPGSYDAIVITVAHQQYLEMGVEAIRALGHATAILFDVKQTFPKESVDGSL